MKKRIGETSYKETTFGVIPRSELIPLEIEGTKKAWDFVMKEYGKGAIPLTPDFLKKVHKRGFGWIFPEIGGRFRTIEVTVSGHTPPKFHMVPQLMTDFMNDIRIRLKYLPDISRPDFLKSLIDLLAWSHHRFLWIHPFADYNGRIGRLLTNMILLNLNLPPVELKVERAKGRMAYVNALGKADEGDYEELRKLIQSSIKEAAEKFDSRKK